MDNLQKELEAEFDQSVIESLDALENLTDNDSVNILKLKTKLKLEQNCLDAKVPALKSTFNKLGYIWRKKPHCDDTYQGKMVYKKLPYGKDNYAISLNAIDMMIKNAKPAGELSPKLIDKASKLNSLRITNWTYEGDEHTKFQRVFIEPEIVLDIEKRAPVIASLVDSSIIQTLDMEQRIALDKLMEFMEWEKGRIEPMLLMDKAQRLFQGRSVMVKSLRKVTPQAAELCLHLFRFQGMQPTVIGFDDVSQMEIASAACNAIYKSVCEKEDDRRFDFVRAMKETMINKTRLWDVAKDDGTPGMKIAAAIKGQSVNVETETSTGATFQSLERTNLRDRKYTARCSGGKLLTWKIPEMDETACLTVTGSGFVRFKHCDRRIRKATIYCTKVEQARNLLIHMGVFTGSVEVINGGTIAINGVRSKVDLLRRLIDSDNEIVLNEVDEVSEGEGLLNGKWDLERHNTSIEVRLGVPAMTNTMKRRVVVDENLMIEIEEGRKKRKLALPPLDRSDVPLGVYVPSLGKDTFDEYCAFFTNLSKNTLLIIKKLVYAKKCNWNAEVFRTAARFGLGGDATLARLLMIHRFNPTVVFTMLPFVHQSGFDTFKRGKKVLYEIGGKKCHKHIRKSRPSNCKSGCAWGPIFEVSTGSGSGPMGDIKGVTHNETSIRVTLRNGNVRELPYVYMERFVAVATHLAVPGTKSVIGGTEVKMVMTNKDPQLSVITQIQESRRALEDAAEIAIGRESLKRKMEMPSRGKKKSSANYSESEVKGIYGRFASKIQQLQEELIKLKKAAAEEQEKREREARGKRGKGKAKRSKPILSDDES